MADQSGSHPWTAFDHINEAKRLLDCSRTATAANFEGENPEGALLIAEAQVHATLAVAWGALGFPAGY